jgi:hypothetical protein
MQHVDGLSTELMIAIFPLCRNACTVHTQLIGEANEDCDVVIDLFMWQAGSERESERKRNLN